MQVNIENTVLETDRLILRAFKETDLSDLYKYASVAGVGEMAGWKHHESLEESKKILQMFIKGKDVFAIVLKSTGMVIGSLGLHAGTRLKEDENYCYLKALELGYVLSKDFWGQGLTVEAVNSVIDYCFSELSLDTLICTHALDNNQSKRVIEKSGFKYIKPAILYDSASDTRHNGALYMLNREIIKKTGEECE